MTRRRRMAVLALVMLVVAGGVVVTYPRQTGSYLSHWTGSPRHTDPLVPFPPDGLPDARVAVAGDIGYPGDRLDATARTVASVAADDDYEALLLLGDNAYPDGDPAELQRTVFRPFRPLLSTGTDLLAILGNHDVRADHAAGQVAALGMAGRWWARTVGPALFVGLDSNQPGNAQQRAWLEDVLAASDATWKIVAVHHPLYSSGYQGSSLDARAAFSPLFERYGVQLVLSGHEHDYERSKPIRGVTYVVSGAAAETRRTGRHDFTAVAVSWHHFVDLNVFADRLVVRAVNQDGRVFDEVVIRP